MNKSRQDILISAVIIFVCFMVIRKNILELNTNSLVVSDELYNSEINSLSPSSNVIIFKTSWCGVCRHLESKLKKENVPYTSFDIEKDLNAANVYEKLLGARSGPVPVTVVGKSIFIGDQTGSIIKKFNEDSKKNTPITKQT